MAASVLLKSASAFTTPREKGVRHPSIRPGTIFAHDFTDPRCNTAADGAIPANQVFVDLRDDNRADGINTTPVGTFANMAGKTGLNVASTYGFGSGIGNPAVRDFKATSFEYVYMLFLRLPATTPSGSYSKIAGQGNSANDGQFWFDTGADNKSFRAFNFGVSATTPSLPGDTLIHFGARMKWDGTTLLSEVYRDAVLVGSGNVTNPTTANRPENQTARPAAAFQTIQPIQAGLRYYSAILTDIGASIAAETALGMPASEILTAAQYIARDNAYGRNQLAGAPRAPY